MLLLVATGLIQGDPVKNHHRCCTDGGGRARRPRCVQGLHIRVGLVMERWQPLQMGILLLLLLLT